VECVDLASGDWTIFRAVRTFAGAKSEEETAAIVHDRGLACFHADARHVYCDPAGSASRRASSEHLGPSFIGGNWSDACICLSAAGAAEVIALSESRPTPDRISSHY